jgi:hypothetical protein
MSTDMTQEEMNKLSQNASDPANGTNRPNGPVQHLGNNLVPKWLYYRLMDFLFLKDKEALHKYRMNTFFVRALHRTGGPKNLASLLPKQ